MSKIAPLWSDWLLSAMLAAKLLYGLYVGELYYSSDLRPLYEFVRRLL